MKNILGKIALLLLFSLSTLHAQKNSINSSSDSSKNSNHDQYTINFTEIKEARLLDSIKKSELESKISSLKPSENLKKKELQTQLEALKKEIESKKVTFDSLRLTVKSFPVNGFFNDTLFFIYNKLGSFSAKDRAEAISKRINGMTDVFGFQKDSLKILDAETTLDIMFGETIIVSVSENDAVWNGISKQELAKKYKLIIGNAVARYQSEISDTTLAKEIGLAILAILVVGFFI